MPYIGKQAAAGQTETVKDSFNGDNSTVAFTMSQSVGLDTDIEVFVGNVQQEPGSGKAYTVSGTTLTFSEAPPTGTGNIYVIHRNSLQGTLLPPQNLGDRNYLIGGDLSLDADGAALKFGVDSEITLTHSADSGLLLKHAATADDSFPTLTLQTGDTDIAQNDILGKIQFQAPDEGTGTDAILVAAGIEAISEGDFSSSSNATSLRFLTGASETAAEKMRIASDGKILVNHTSSQTMGPTTEPQIQIEGTDNHTGSMSIIRNSNDNGQSLLILGKSRGTSVNANTVVQADDNVGEVLFVAADGSDKTPQLASIKGVVDGTPGSNDMPGRLAFSTTADGSQTITERMRLDSTGDLDLLTDGASIFFGADSEIELRHVADDGLILKHVGTGDGKEPSLTFQAGDNDIAQDDVLGSIFFQAPDEGAGTDAILVAAGIEAISEGDFSSSSNATSLIFKTGASEAATEKMRVQSDGKVGIGTTSPAQLLHVKADNPGGKIRLEMGQTGVANTDVTGEIQFFQNDSSGAGINADIKGICTNSVGAGALTFGTGTTSATERMRIDADGDVTIADGDLVIGTAGHGIDFSNATDEGSGETTTSSVLDDYEEGSFSVAEQNSSLGMTLNFAEYTKIGRAIHFILHVTFGSGTDSSPIQLTGMPFDGNNSKIQTVSVFTNYTGGTIIPIVQSSTIFMQKNNATVDLTYSDVSGKFVRLSGTYQIL